MILVGAGHSRSRSVPLRSSERRRVSSHSACLRAVARRRQSFRLDARALDVGHEGAVPRLCQGRGVGRGRAGRAAAVAGRRRARPDRTTTSQRPHAAARSVRRASAAEEQSRRHQCDGVRPPAQRSAVRQGPRQPERHQVLHRTIFCESYSCDDDSRLVSAQIND